MATGTLSLAHILSLGTLIELDHFAEDIEDMVGAMRDVLGVPVDWPLPPVPLADRPRPRPHARKAPKVYVFVDNSNTGGVMHMSGGIARFCDALEAGMPCAMRKVVGSNMSLDAVSQWEAKGYMVKQVCAMPKAVRSLWTRHCTAACPSPS